MSSRSRLKKNQPINSPYLKHIPLLLLSLIFLFLIINVLSSKNPEEVANWGIAQAYLPLISPFFFFMTFLSGYLLLNIKRGGVIGLFTTLLLLFRLQQINFAAWWLVPFMTIFLVFVFLAKKTKREKSRENSRSIHDENDN